MQVGGSHVECADMFCVTPYRVAYLVRRPIDIPEYMIDFLGAATTPSLNIVLE